MAAPTNCYTHIAPNINEGQDHAPFFCAGKLCVLMTWALGLGLWALIAKCLGWSWLCA